MIALGAPTMFFPRAQACSGRLWGRSRAAGTVVSEVPCVSWRVRRVSSKAAHASAAAWQATYVSQDPIPIGRSLPQIGRSLPQIGLPLGDDDEGRLDIDARRFDRLDDFQDVLGRYMTRAKVDNARERHFLRDDQRPKVAVVRQDYPAYCNAAVRPSSVT